MKSIGFALLALCVGHMVQSQEVQVPESEFTGTILLVRDAGSGEKLEKQKAAVGSKANVGAALFGVAKGKGMNVVNGTSSPVRADSTDALHFIVKAQGNDRDPFEVVNVFRLQPDGSKNKRILIVGTVRFSESTASDIDFIPFDAVKYGESSYLLTLRNLSPGEYAMTLDGSRDVFNLFGVD